VVAAPHVGRLEGLTGQRVIIPSVVLLAVGICTLVVSLGWPSRAALFPTWISVAVIVLVTGHLAVGEPPAAAGAAG